MVLSLQSWLWESCSASHQVVLRESCSTSSCSFVVFMMGRSWVGKLWIPYSTTLILPQFQIISSPIEIGEEIWKVLGCLSWSVVLRSACVHIYVHICTLHMCYSSCVGFGFNSSTLVLLKQPAVLVLLGMWLGSKESACNAGDLGSIPGSGRSPAKGNGNPLQYSCLENPHGQRSLVGYSPWGVWRG